MRFFVVAAALLAAADATDTLRSNRNRAQSATRREKLVPFMGDCTEQIHEFRMKLAQLSDKDMALQAEYPGPTNAEKRWTAYQVKHKLLGVCTPGTYCRTATAEDVTNYGPGGKLAYDRRYDGPLELSVHQKFCFACPDGQVTNEVGECVACPTATYIDSAGKSTTGPLTAASPGKGKPAGRSIMGCRCVSDKVPYAVSRSGDKVTCKASPLQCSIGESRGPCPTDASKECCTKCPAGSANFGPGEPCFKCDSAMKAEHNKDATGVELREDFDGTAIPDAKLGCKCKASTEKDPMSIALFGYLSTAADFPPPTHFPAATYKPWCMPIYPADYDAKFNPKGVSNPKLARAGSRVPSAQLDTVNKQLGWNMLPRTYDELWNPRNKGEPLDKTMKDCPKDNVSGMRICKDACTPKSPASAGAATATEADVATPAPLTHYISCSSELQVNLIH